jgi:hypothetical protein
MNIFARGAGDERIHIWIVIALALTLAIYTGVLVGDAPVHTFVFVLTVVSLIAWVTTARRVWWVLMPAAAVLGGYFYFGFRIYPHEVALLACLVPLGIAQALRATGLLQTDRPLFPVAMHFLSWYLIAHWIGSNIYNRLNGETGYGNVTRAYFNALWVIVFLFAFRRYGSSKYIPAALTLTYFAAAARVLATIVIYLFGAFAYVPVVNYVLPGSTESRVTDLRTSGLTLAMVALCYFLIHKNFARKFFHGAIFLGSFVALLFGAGRGSLVLLCLVTIFAAALYRKIVPMILSLLVIGSLIFALNTFPSLLNDSPFAVQRAASILLLDKADAARYGKTEGSDKWHAELREVGYKKWTQSWSTFFFGTGIRPYDNAIIEFVPGKTTEEDFLESSSKVGGYESGWWTVIAVTGLLGLISYVIVLLYLLRRLVPVLLKEKVKDHRHAFALIGVFGILNWLILGWANGSFPSSEIMFAFLGFFALEDERRAKQRGSRNQIGQEITSARLEPALRSVR